MRENMDKEYIADESLIIQGIKEAEIGNLEAALQLFQKAINNNENNYIAWYNRGIVLDNLGRFDEAIAFFDKALEIKPDYIDAW